MTDTTDEPIYHLNEGTVPLDVPGTWEDNSLQVLRLPGAGQANASLVITRETLPLGQEVADYQRAELERLRVALPGFALKGRVPIAWADAAGEALLTRWRSDDGEMDQIVTCRRTAGRRLLVFTATHRTPMPTGTYDTFMAAIAGFRPRPAGDPVPIAG